jgi:hypothetical protein
MFSQSRPVEHQAGTRRHGRRWIRSALIRLHDDDQAIRFQIDHLTHTTELAPAARKRALARSKRLMARDDRERQHAFKALIRDYGWPAASALGNKAAIAAFVLVLHCPDVMFQKTCLRLLKKGCASGSNDPYHYLFLWDRIAVTEGRKQRFGTQLARLPDGEWALLPVENVQRIDERRRRYGVMPLAQQIRAQERFEARLRKRDERPTGTRRRVAPEAVVSS